MIMEFTDYSLKDIDEKESRSNHGKKLLRRLLIAELYDEAEYNLLKGSDEESHVDQFYYSLSPKDDDIIQEAIDWWNRLPSKEKRKIKAQLKEEMELDAPIPSLKLHKEPTPSLTEPTPNSSDELVSKLIADFMNIYFDRKERSGSPAPKSTKDEYKSIYKEFLEIIGPELRCCDLNKEVIKKYEKILWGLPSNYEKRKPYKELSLKQIIELNIPKDHLRAAPTYNKYIMRVKTFLRWAAEEEYIKSGLDNFLKPLPDKIKANKKKDAFSEEELRLLFNNEIYENHKFKQPSRYWLPLLALFTGARGEELASLFTDDIKQDEKTKIDYIDIKVNIDRNQLKKNITAERIVPIHKKLIALGFLEYVNSLQNESPIFPELDKKSGSRYKKFGNNFNRKEKSGWMRKCGVDSEKTSFHSFRHNVIDYLDKTKTPERVSCAIVGHKPKGGGLVENYVKDADIKTLHKAINKLNFPSIDWRKIRKANWDQVGKA